MKCPKCGKEAWVIRVQRHSTKGLNRTTYEYDVYRHYVGSKKYISLKILAEIFDAWNLGSYSQALKANIMSAARVRAGTKRIEHTVRVK